MTDLKYDEDTYANAADECLTMPEDFGCFDDRLYTTHGPVLSWAERGDDLVDESNFHTVLAHLQERYPDDVEDASVGHWMVGSLRQIVVRVLTEAGDVTPAFKEAYDIVKGLREDYPLFDEDDHSEREWADLERFSGEAFDWAADLFDDELTDVEVIALRAQALEDYTQSNGYGDPSWLCLIECYAEARTEIFGD